MSATDRNDGSNGEDAVLKTSFEPATEEPISVVIVGAVLDAAEAETTEVDLYESIDPEAINAMYRHAQNHADATWSFSFTVGEFEITLWNDGDLVVR